MKLLRFGEPGQERPGALDSNGVVRDLSALVDDIAGPALSPEGLSVLAGLHLENCPIVTETRLGPCVGRIGKFLCIGLNYADHAAETGAAVPDEPVLFMKATSAVSGPNDPIIKPRGSTKLDWEVELGIVIGTEARYVDASTAMDHIAGFCVVNDVSERQFQRERGGTWDKGKGCDSFGPIGPWLVTKDEITDIDNLRLWLSVNGEPRQNGNTANMIFKPAALVSYISQFMSLQPGDIISTGTPPGVGLGMTPPQFLDVGDTLELGIDGLGTQAQRVINWND